MLLSTFYPLLSICYLLLVLPSVVSATTIKIFNNPDPTLNFTKLTDKFSSIGNDIITFLIGVALVAIIWGAFKYVRAAGDAEKIAEGRKVAVYGIIALFLMLSFWGFVMIIRTSLFGSS